MMPELVMLERKLAMIEQHAHHSSAMELLQQMFDVELRFIRADSDDLGLLASAFHPRVVVHEPQSLPYSGDWAGLEGIGALFRKMREVWSDISVEGLEAARSGDTVFMGCKLSMTSRSNGRRLVQPFAEVLRFRNGLLIEGTPFYYDTSEIVETLKG